MGSNETQQTLAIIKPDGVARGLTGEIIRRIEKSGLQVIGLKMVRIEKEDAERFYAVHRQRPFFGSLTRYMASGVIVPMVLQGESAIKRLRDLMGATNPKEAAKGTIRAEFGESIEQNTIHGSDSPDTATAEVAFFFKDSELISR